MTPLDYYQEQCANGFVVPDQQQLIILQNFQNLYHELVLAQQKRFSFFSFLRSPHLVHGIYLWGSVGIGKTFLMDCFYHSLPFTEKMRMHFHQFMQQVHLALKEHQGEKDPLKIIAKEYSKKTIIICLDELFVSDITDAMILGRLFNALFSEGVCLVATSNTAPDDLYKNGLQRLNFLPAIALLKKNLHVLQITSTQDYRLRHLKEAGVFYSPLDNLAKRNMEMSFNALTVGQKITETPFEMFGRKIPIKRRSDEVIWFEFNDICHVPRSQKDYLAIAEQFKTVLISNVPKIDPHEKDTICLFISMIDVFYDARIRVVISAAEPVAQIYQQGFMILEYTRTHSRLTEMQSVDYFTGEFNH